LRLAKEAKIKQA